VAARVASNVNTVLECLAMQHVPTLFIATPCYGGLVTSSYTNSLMALYAACLGRRMPLTWHLMEDDAMITRARAELVASFLKTDATHLFFIDADIGFAPEQVFRLLDFGSDFCAGAYPLKDIDWSKIARAASAGKIDLEMAAMNYVLLWHAKGGKVEARNGFARVRHAGAGFLLVTRTAINKLCSTHPGLAYDQVHAVTSGKMAERCRSFALFDPIIDRNTGEYLSEDYAFCRRWTDLGGEIWMDTQSKLTHTGAMVFRGDLSTKFK
jgi:hypothetical protein